MTDNPWMNQPDVDPYPRGDAVRYADPVAQRRIDQLEAAIGDLYKARDEAEMERDRLRAILTEARAALDDPAAVLLYRVARAGHLLRKVDDK